MDSGERAQLSEFMRRLADGDRSAFDPVFRAAWPPVLALARRLCGDDADDVAQDALVRVFARADEYDPRLDALPWILGVAAWSCRSARRRAWRRREHERTEPSAELAAPDPTPEHVVIERDLVEAMTAVLGGLTQLDREALQATGVGADADAGRGARLRKRRQRALVRLRLAWRRIHG